MGEESVVVFDQKAPVEVGHTMELISEPEVQQYGAVSLPSSEADDDFWVQPRQEYRVSTLAQVRMIARTMQNTWHYMYFFSHPITGKRHGRRACGQPCFPMKVRLRKSRIKKIAVIKRTT